MLNKKLSIVLLPAIFICQVSFSCYGQDKNRDKLANKIEPLAREYFRIGDYNRALEGYKMLDSIYPENTEYNYNLGLCYLHSNYKSRAYPYLEFAYNQPDAPPDIFFELGRAYQLGDEFDKAIIFYESYIKQLKYGPEADKNQDKIAQISRYIQMCRNGQRLVRSPLLNVTVVNLGPSVNSKYTDFAPLINASENILIFTSKRPAPGKKSDPLTNQYYESIFRCTKENGAWQPAGYIPAPIYHTDVHDAAVGLSPGGDKLFLYRGGTNNFASRIEGDIYVSTNKNDKWSEPRPVTEINSTGWESHASVDSAENILIFTSDREGGVGGTDIYFSRKKLNGQWTVPENIGEYINTPYDEDGPFISPDGTKLYFSSKGHNSMGGYDIFYSEYLAGKGKWTRPVNMGYPINTADDDIYFVWSADGERAYFSSVREDTYGDADIYMLTRNDQRTPIAEVKGRTIEKFGQLPVKSEIIVRELLSNHLIGIFDSDEQGNFSMKLKSGRKYNVIIRASGYQESVSVINLKPSEEPYSLAMDFDLRKK